MLRMGAGRVGWGGHRGPGSDGALAGFSGSLLIARLENGLPDKRWLQTIRICHSAQIPDEKYGVKKLKYL